MCRPKCEGGMGYKELSKFNDLLLSKQIWCFDNNENSLFHKVFKEKFFLDCSVRTKFKSLAQKVDGLRTKKPKPMNL